MVSLRSDDPQLRFVEWKMAAKSIRKQVTCCAPVNIAVIKYCELHACSLVGGYNTGTRDCTGLASPYVILPAIIKRSGHARPLAAVP